MRRFGSGSRASVPLIARRLRRRRGPSSGVWHLDEMFVKIAGRQMYLWRAVDGEGEILDMLVQSRRDKAAALLYRSTVLRHRSTLMPPWPDSRADRLGPGLV